MLMIGDMYNSMTPIIPSPKGGLFYWSPPSIPFSLHPLLSGGRALGECLLDFFCGGGVAFLVPLNNLEGLGW